MSSRHAFTRRSFLVRSGALVGATTLAPFLRQGVPSTMGGGFRLQAPLASPDIVLDPTNPTNFIQDGGQQSTPGSVLTLSDGDVADIVAFWAADANASAGTTLDVIATFQILSTLSAGADADNRLVINDGVSRAAIASCVTISNVRGIGLLSAGSAFDPASYPLFVPVDWEAAPVTVRLRRWANGDAELVEVNGVSPSPRALLVAAQVAGPSRLGFGSVEFGCASVQGKCTVAYSAFQAEVVNVVVDAALTITRIGAIADRRGDAAAGGTFTDADPLGTLSQYTGTIDWGDSTPPSQPQFARNPFGGFAAGGLHHYASPGTYTVTIAISDSGGASTSKSATVTVPHH